MPLNPRPMKPPPPTLPWPFPKTCLSTPQPAPSSGSTGRGLFLRTPRFLSYCTFMKVVLFASASLLCLFMNLAASGGRRRAIAWELMEGLEDTSPLRPPNHLRSFSFDIDQKSIPAPFDLPPPPPPSRDFRNPERHQHRRAPCG